MSEEGFQAAQNVNESAATSVYPAPRLVDVAPGLRRGKYNLTRFNKRFNKIAVQGTPQMAVDKEAICLSRVYSYYPKCNFPLFYV